jgi:RimJ/RimL family protein N-acetyltransferase
MAEEPSILIEQMVMRGWLYIGRVPPSLDTDRLTLTAHTLADFEESAAMWADAAVTRFIGGRPASREDVWNRLLRYRGLWALLGYGYWAVNERETGRYVGDVGFADFHRDITPSLDGAPEAGWVLATWAHGRGFATEAVRAALGWGDTHLASRTGGPPRYACIISAENAASVRVAEKCGFGRANDATYKGHPTTVYARVVPHPE